MGGNPSLRGWRGSGAGCPEKLPHPWRLFFVNPNSGNGVRAGQGHTFRATQACAEHQELNVADVPVAGKGDEAQELNYLMLGRGNES